MFKFITAFGANSFSAAGLSQNTHPMDTDMFRFSFVVYGVAVKEFCETVQKIYLNYKDHDKYGKYDDILIKSSSPKDALRITRDGQNLNISRGNLKVIYSGSVSVMYNLCKQLESDYGKHLQAL